MTAENRYADGGLMVTERQRPLLERNSHLVSAAVDRQLAFVARETGVPLARQV